MSDQLPLRPPMLHEVEPPAPYPPFPLGERRLWDRCKWALDAPVTGVRDHRQGGTAKHLLLLLAYYANTDGVAWPGRDTLARNAGVDQKTVRRAINSLVATGWITREERPGKTPRYRPKAPSNEHCPGCRVELAPSIKCCPSCGAEREEVGPLFRHDAAVGGPK